MKILLLTTPNHIYANYLVKKLMMRQEQYEIVAIIESTVLLPGKKYLEAICKYLKTSGLFFVIMQATKMWFFRLACVLNKLAGCNDVDSVFFGYPRIAKSMGVPIFKSSDINSKSSNILIKSLNPDLIIILLFGQILKETTINLAPMGIINFHPSYLPNYRGLMPVFWALSNNESQGGVTLHFVDTGIDTGAIISRVPIPITDKDTEHSLYARSCVMVPPLIFDSINRIKTDRISNIDISKEKKGRYFSLPTLRAVRKYRKNGRKFFTFSELLSSFEEL